ncbi:MAG: hypothetical protein AB9919_02920 [Geobacteraceae bacterium]|jgi:hypothetical protein
MTLDEIDPQSRRMITSRQLPERPAKHSIFFAVKPQITETLYTRSESDGSFFSLTTDVLASQVQFEGIVTATCRPFRTILAAAGPVAANTKLGVFY